MIYNVFGGTLNLTVSTFSLQYHLALKKSETVTFLSLLSVCLVGSAFAVIQC